MLGAFARSQGLSLVTCSADEVFGPWQADTCFLSRLLAAISVGRPFALEAAGERVRDWLPVGDFASGLLRAAEAGELAGLKESPAVGSVVASDAFFPFADGLLAAAEAGATAVIQPGGSLRDKEVIAAADEHKMAMVFTGVRHFRH